MAAVIEYVEKDSFLHGLHPLSKLAAALVILVIAILFNDYYFMLALLTATLVLAKVGKVYTNISRLFKGLLVFAGILFVMQVAFYEKGHITDQGILVSLAMALRMLAIIISFLILLSTTKIQDMSNVLVEKFHIPYDYAFMFQTAMRFIPTFMAEMKHISDAQKARGFVLEGWNPITKIKAYLPLAVPLVLISLKKAQTMAIAMETRGYATGKRTCLREVKATTKDLVFTLVLGVILASAIVLRLRGYGLLEL